MSRGAVAGFVIATVVAGLSIAVFAALIPLAHWHSDEFLTFNLYRADGVRFSWQRLTTWSPRPISEVLLYAYSKVVESTGSPWMPEFVALVWAGSALIVSAPVVQSVRRGGSAIAAAAVACVLTALCIAGPENGQVLYWCQAAVAYLPLLALLIFVALRVVLGLEDIHMPSWTLVTALLVGAFVVEVGAMFSVAFTLVLLGESLVHGRPDRLRLAQRLALPFGGAVVVLMLLWTGRVAANSEQLGDLRVIHRLGPSVVLAAARFPREFVLLPGIALSAGNVMVLFGSKLLFAVACVCLFRSRLVAHPPSSRLLSVLAIVATSTGFVQLVGSYYQFGSQCCERGATIREALAYLPVLGVAGAMSARVERFVPEGLRSAAPYALAIALIAPMRAAWPALHHDYAWYQEIAGLGSRIWTAARQPDEELRFRLGEQARAADVMAGYQPGRFEENSRNAGAEMMRQYFRKRSVVIDP